MPVSNMNVNKYHVYIVGNIVIHSLFLVIWEMVCKNISRPPSPPERGLLHETHLSQDQSQPRCSKPTAAVELFKNYHVNMKEPNFEIIQLTIK